ncbi:APG6-domain-containing protein [Stemphylium lycopersici]|uniref:APG6-domain-containing protein n=1 Tax=Stemphylium lycopersici TaxID=183478 RepID=A0A364NCF2_STELY|nr:APG6-domain-containing protein [Stemphylium lycopersici]
MANNKKPAGLACQKCRTPINIDTSIDQLNPAAFKLLTDSAVSGQLSAPKISPNRQSRPPNPPEHLKTYQDAAKDARNPTHKRNAQGAPPSRSSNGPQNPAMSFIDVHMSESMIDPPPESAHKPVGKAQAEDTKSDANDKAQRKGVSNGLGTAGGASLADELETTNRMFEILSARSDIDHPICVECTEILLEGLQKRLGVATRERDAYVDYLRRANTDVPSAEEVKAADAALKAAKKAESTAITQLENLESEKADLDSQIAALEAEARILDQEENEFWKSRNAFNSTLTEFQNERDALATRYAHDAQVLNQLQRRSVYNDTFNITHDNHFATINGLRLGRLPNPYVDWPEINAAWGQTCLLLATLAERLGYKFVGYELCPMGSTSTITRIENKGGTAGAESTRQQQQASTNTASSPHITKQRLELYSSGDFPINFGFLHRKFDAAMVAFLECLRQLGEFVENSAPPSAGAGAGAGAAPGGGGVKMPYEIRKDRIHDQSIKLALNKDEDTESDNKAILLGPDPVFMLHPMVDMQTYSGKLSRINSNWGYQGMQPARASTILLHALTIFETRPVKCLQTASVMRKPIRSRDRRLTVMQCTWPAAPTKKHGLGIQLNSREVPAEGSKPQVEHDGEESKLEGMQATGTYVSPGRSVHAL